MAFTVADLSGVKKQVNGLGNFAAGYSETPDDDKITSGLLAESIFEGDERFYTAGAESKGHWMRPEIMDWCTAITTYLDEVPAHIGELGEVRIKYVSTDSVYQLAKPMKREEIEIYRNNTDSYLNASHSASGTLVAGYFDPEALRDGVCAFTGYALQIRLATYARTSALQCPQVYTSAIVAHALSQLFSVDGLDPELAKYYSVIADKYEAQIRANAKVLTEFPELKRAA